MSVMNSAWVVRACCVSAYVLRVPCVTWCSSYHYSEYTNDKDNITCCETMWDLLSSHVPSPIRTQEHTECPARSLAYLVLQNI